MSSTTPGSDPERHEDERRHRSTTTDPSTRPTPEPAAPWRETGPRRRAGCAVESEPAPELGRRRRPSPPTDDLAGRPARLDEAVERANARPAAASRGQTASTTWTTSATPRARAPPTPCAARPTCRPRRSRPAPPRAPRPSPTSPSPLYVAPQPGAADHLRAGADAAEGARATAASACSSRSSAPSLFALLYAGVGVLLLLPRTRAAADGAVGVRRVPHARSVLGAGRRVLHRLRAARGDREPRPVVDLRGVRPARRRARLLLVHRRRTAHGRGVDAHARPGERLHRAALARPVRDRRRPSSPSRSRSGSAAGSPHAAAPSPSATGSPSRRTTASSLPARRCSGTERRPGTDGRAVQRRVGFLSPRRSGRPGRRERRRAGRRPSR